MPEDAVTSEAIRLAVVADSPVVGPLVREVLATTLPGSDASMLDPRSTTMALQRIDCVIVDGTIGDEPGVVLLRRIRAGGYAGGAVLLLEGSAEDARITADAAALGARCVSRDELVHSLAAAVVDAMATQGGDAATTRARDALRRSQRLIAAGEIALKMQHSLNNPLAALLAEAQLLAMEPLEEEHRAAVERMVELCRRVIAIVRKLDGIGGPDR